MNKGINQLKNTQPDNYTISSAAIESYDNNSFNMYCNMYDKDKLYIGIDKHNAYEQGAMTIEQVEQWLKSWSDCQ